jgi:hypothetical protein
VGEVAWGAEESGIGAEKKNSKKEKRKIEAKEGMGNKETSREGGAS